MNSYLLVLKKYAVFSGRAARSEYWLFFLFNLLIGVTLAVIEVIAGMGRTLDVAYSLAVLLPGLAVAVRRLHDTGHSGWWLLLALVPFVGLVVLAFLAQASDAAENRYGPNPKQSVTRPNLTEPRIAVSSR